MGMRAARAEWSVASLHCAHVGGIDIGVALDEFAYFSDIIDARRLPQPLVEVGVALAHAPTDGFLRHGRSAQHRLVFESVTKLLGMNKE